MTKFFYRMVAVHIRGRRGFTLIELLVVLVVTTLLSSFLIVYNSMSRRQIALYVEEAKLVQVISRAKSLSISTYREPSSAICGYGVHIDYGSMSYTLFSYTKSPSVECEKITSIDLTAEKPLSTFSLNRELVFMAVPPKSGKRIDDVIFIPPDPVTLMNSGGILLSNGFGNIALRTQDGSAEVVVIVSSAGQITF